MLVLLVACAHRLPEMPEPPPAAETELDWMLGTWQGKDTQETWVRGPGALVGVSFAGDDATTGYEVMVVSVAPEGGLGFRAFPGGQGGVRFPASARGADAVAFENRDHDFPQVIRYAKVEGALHAEILGGDGRGERWKFVVADAVAAPEAEAADLAFAADSAARGADAWADVFLSDGAMFGDARIEGPDAVRAMMAPVFERGVRIDWRPVASGLAPAGDAAFTVGEAEYRDPSGAVVHTGGYVTVWRRDADAWKVWFDTGLP